MVTVADNARGDVVEVVGGDVVDVLDLVRTNVVDVVGAVVDADVVGGIAVDGVVVDVVDVDVVVVNTMPLCGASVACCTVWPSRST